MPLQPLHSHPTERPPRRVPVSTETEAQFQTTILQLARVRGWRNWHDYDSRRNAAGLPDLILVRAPRLVVAEVKRAGGHLRPEQRAWLDELRGCPGVEAYVWYPCDWPDIERTLA